MCLILFAFQHHPDYPLIVTANRDETYTRPTAAAHLWPDAGGILGGRDLQAQGTWLAINQSGRFAAVTNVREAGAPGRELLSRGELTTTFLSSGDSAMDCLLDLQQRQQQFAGFNLLAGDFSDGRSELYCLSNRRPTIEVLRPGVHGLSNGYLNEPWPKVSGGISALQQAIASGQAPAQLLQVLLDDRAAHDCELPATGVDLKVERGLSSRFIRSVNYGTRACTVLTLERTGAVHFYEQEFLAGGASGQLSEHRFTLEAGAARA